MDDCAAVAAALVDTEGTAEERERSYAAIESRVRQAAAASSSSTGEKSEKTQAVALAAACVQPL
eukprot:COSAG02_NODE_18594_length_930_cov_1.239471_2_plen_64_part_00